MENRWTSVLSYLPSLFTQAILSVPPHIRCEAHELRIRRHAPLLLTTATDRLKLSVRVCTEQVQECFLRFCDHAVHTHQAELAQGFVTTKDGFRVGVAGTAVIKDGEILSYRDIRSLCVRLSKRVDGCAGPLLRFIDHADGIRGMLLCGAPSSGKTTLLRDLAALLSDIYQIAVVDERRELLLGELPYCDVLSDCPKVIGILQAVRTLSPDAVIVDEIGDEREWRAVEQSCYLGVPVIASVHATTPSELLSRPQVRRLIQNGGISVVAFLPSRSRFCEPTHVWKARDLLENIGDRADRVYLRGHGNIGGDASAKRRAPVESVGDLTATSLRVATVYGTADTGAAIHGEERGSHRTALA